MNKTPNTSKGNRLKPTLLLLTIVLVIGISLLLLETAKLLAINLPSLLLPICLVGLLTLVFIALIDTLLTQKITAPLISRSLPNQLIHNRWQAVHLLIDNPYPNAISLTLFDHCPDNISFEQLPQTITVAANTQYLLQYPIKALERGACQWQICEITLTSPCQLWQQRRYLQVTTKSRVYPNFTQFYGKNINTIEQWINQLGVRSQPKRGLGQDFHQLREFREGDTLRQIDWNATAKYKRPITKEYQDEKDQNIIFLLDCGQRMRIKEEPLSHFDHALNACLLLSHIALKQGDAVGLTTFATDTPLFIKPAKGQQQLTTLLNHVYDLPCTKQPADYHQAIKTLLAKIKRRSLVIIITNLRYTEPKETITAFKQLSKYHKVLIASLREEIRDEITHTPIHHMDEALTYCGNIHQLLNRSKLHDQLALQHLPILDITPKHLGPELVNHYLALKRSNVL